MSIYFEPGHNGVSPGVDITSPTLAVDVVMALAGGGQMRVLPDRHQIVTCRQRAGQTTVLVTVASPHCLGGEETIFVSSGPYAGEWTVGIGDDGDPLEPTQFLINGPYTQDAGSGAEWGLIPAEGS